MLEKLLQSSGFIYQIGHTYYFLGKWICKECIDSDATDSVAMYQMCREAGETQEAGMYFHKLRAYSDFALDIPYNPAKIKAEMSALLDGLSETGLRQLEAQFLAFEEDYPLYCI